MHKYIHMHNFIESLTDITSQANDIGWLRQERKGLGLVCHHQRRRRGASLSHLEGRHGA